MPFDGVAPVTTRIRLDQPRQHKHRRIRAATAMEHRARMAYWLTMREAADLLGVSRQRAAVIVEDRRMRTERVRVGWRTHVRVALCCIEAEAAQHGCRCGRKR